MPRAAVCGLPHSASEVNYGKQTAILLDTIYARYIFPINQYLLKGIP